MNNREKDITGTKKKISQLEEKLGKREISKFIKKVFNFCFGWVNRLKKDSQDEMRTVPPSLQGINNKDIKERRVPVYLREISQVIENSSPRQLKSILEWGAGKSTALFYEAAVKNQSEIFVSIDSHEQYLFSVIENFKEADFFRPLLVPLSEIARYHYAGDNDNVCFYSSCPLHYRRPFDLIFVDGRARNECMLLAALLASSEANIIVHDFRRVRMTPAKFLFDEVDSDFKTILLLKRKKSLETFFNGFLEDEMAALKEAPIIASYNGYRKTRDDDLSEIDITSLQHAVKKYLGRSRRVVEWGTPASTQLILTHLEKVPADHYLTIVHSLTHRDEITKSGAKYPFFDARAVSLRGKCEIGSRDPNFHYSSCPIYFKKKFDFFYVGSERRNECLLTAALLLEQDGIAILRDGDLLHYALGKYFFDTIEGIGGFRVMKRKPLLDQIFGSFLDNLPENARAANFDPP